jgi:hypothetical protein
VYVKEPKIAVGLCPEGAMGERLRWYKLFRSDGRMFSVSPLDLNTIGHPGENTLQIHADARCRVRFQAADGHSVSVIARANTSLSYGVGGKPTSYGIRSDWEGGMFGLDLWAERSNGATGSLGRRAATTA